MRRVGDELPPWKGLVFPRRTVTLPNVPHDAGTFLVGNEQDRFRRPYGLDRGKRNRSPANPGQSKERSLHIKLDTLNATEGLAISSDCGKPLTPFEPVLSHGASAPKTGSSTCLDAWSPGFEPGRGHRTDCLRFAKQASCDRSPSIRDFNAASGGGAFLAHWDLPPSESECLRLLRLSSPGSQELLRRRWLAVWKPLDLERKERTQ